MEAQRMPEGLSWPKAMYEIDSHKIITGDCLKVMSGMEAASVDIVVTSPPYNLDLAYGVYDDTKTEEDYIQWRNCSPWSDVCLSR